MLHVRACQPLAAFFEVGTVATQRVQVQQIMIIHTIFMYTSPIYPEVVYLLSQYCFHL